MMEGHNIGPFKVERELGSGAMGTVFLARYEKTNQQVAIKVINVGLGTNEKTLARFEREANILKNLKHANIVRLFAIGKFQKSPFYAMEYIPGETLESMYERRGRLSWEEVVDIGKQIC